MIPPAENKPAEKKKLNPVLLLFLIFPLMGIVAAIALLNQHPVSTTLQPPDATYVPVVGLINMPAPDFTLKNISNQDMQLSSYHGKWVFLNFWATWCIPCKAEMPNLQKLVSGGFGDYSKDLQVISVDFVENPDTVKSWLSANNLTVPVVLDPDSVAITAYGVNPLPETFVIDPNGIVKAKILGEMTPTLINQYLEIIRNARDVEL